MYHRFNYTKLMHHIYSTRTRYFYSSTCFDVALTVIKVNLCALHLKPPSVTQLLSKVPTLVKGKSNPVTVLDRP